VSGLIDINQPRRQTLPLRRLSSEPPSERVETPAPAQLGSLHEPAVAILGT
jgi:hypothetical protein